MGPVEHFSSNASSYDICYPLTDGQVKAFEEWDMSNLFHRELGKKYGDIELTGKELHVVLPPMRLPGRAVGWIEHKIGTILEYGEIRSLAATIGYRDISRHSS